MFSYTDDAIVTSSPTGRHLSTVIRRPAAIGPLDWTEHADRVCKVLNELDRNAKLNYRVSYSHGAGLQTAGRVKRLTDFGAVGDGPCNCQTGPTTAPIAELEKQLDDATTKLCAAQMLLEQADGKVSKLETKLTEALGVRKVRVPMKSLSVLASSYGVVMHFADQKLTIESA